MENNGEEKLTYKSAGVDTKEGERAVQLMKEHVKKTFNSSVLTGLGSFGSLYQLDLEGISEPVLVSGTDGVGTKLKLAFMMDKHDTVGQDCVAMCVNDVLCQGAKPLFFLDYLATGRVEAEKIALVVKGIADGCLLAGCALVGGETAEMPGFYQDGEYDMAGFAVGVADKSRIVDGSNIREGDLLIGLPSSGVHSNGFSLVRKVFFEKMGFTPDTYIDGLEGTLGDVLIRPTRIYAMACNAVLPQVNVKGMVHITGGGFYENVPRVMPWGLGVAIERKIWPALPIFDYIKECGEIEDKEMFSTFNMGIGMIMFVSPGDGDKTLALLKAVGEQAYVIGRVVNKSGVAIDFG